MAEKNIVVNRKARHDYEIVERIEAGLVLTGTEIKSIRDGRISLREAYARPEGSELWLVGAHIAPYPAASRFNHEPTRRRKLLLHKSEIRELARAVNEGGLTLIPLRLYLKRGMAKLELALARGRRKYDKRQAIARREAERQMQRALRQR
jgi:SsrA-binding protein